MRSKLLVLTLLTQGACSGDDAASETSDVTGVSTATASNSASASTSMSMTTESIDTTSTGSETTSASGAPFIISFSTNVGMITEGQSVVFTATVSDPDGLDDIAGGTLLTGGGGFTYGPFLSAGQGGVYSITVSWTQMHQVEPIEFEDGEVSRSFRAEFFDKDGNKVAQETPVKLFCAGGGACSGGCVDFQTDGENCGACGLACTDGCSDAKCLPAYGECISLRDGFSTCSDYCGSIGEMCAEDGCVDATVQGWNSYPSCVAMDAAPFYFSEPCDAAQTWGPGRSIIRCCCSDTN